jgi:hypothetical protein
MQWMILKAGVPVVADGQAVVFDDAVYGDAAPGGPGPAPGDEGFTTDLVAAYAPTVAGDGWSYMGPSWRPAEDNPA